MSVGVYLSCWVFLVKADSIFTKTEIYTALIRWIHLPLTQPGNLKANTFEQLSHFSTKLPVRIHFKNSTKYSNPKAWKNLDTGKVWTFFFFLHFLSRSVFTVVHTHLWFVVSLIQNHYPLHKSTFSIISSNNLCKSSLNRNGFVRVIHPHAECAFTLSLTDCVYRNWFD